MLVDRIPPAISKNNATVTESVAALKSNFKENRSMYGINICMYADSS